MNDIERKREELKRLQNEVRNAEINCKHNWVVVSDDYWATSPPMYHIGDKWLGGGDYLQKRWKRTCKNCGKVETTEREFEEIVKTKKPAF